MRRGVLGLHIEHNVGATYADETGQLNYTEGTRMVCQLPTQHKDVNIWCPKVRRYEQIQDVVDILGPRQLLTKH